MKKRGLRFTHFYSSNLSRANQTAKAIRDAQISKPEDKIHVKRLECLREQDFGFYEGKPFYARPPDSNKTGKEEHRAQHIQEPGFQDVESKESLMSRADHFTHQHLLPLICEDGRTQEYIVAVVSHGIMLNSLWRSILKLFAQRTVSIAPGVSVGGASGSAPLEYLGGWSNTGYLELDIRPAMSGNPPVASESDTQDASSAKTDTLSSMAGLAMVVRAINGKEHLQGLKRTRNVGSGKHDEKQKTMDSYFNKKHKIG